MRSSPKSPSTAASLLAPEPDCSFCPRLVAYCAANRSGNPDWFNAPVPSFGCLDARLLVVGMAPGIRGANRTGRPFTGDHAGILLYQTLIRFGFATGVYRADPSDGVALHDCRIVNAVRCVPPANLPTPAEVKTCNQFLASELRSLPYLRVAVVLGLLAHAAVLRTLSIPLSRYKFAHGTLHTLPNGLLLADSYHVSRYNTNTGRLTTEMFEAVIAEAKARL